MPEIRFVRPMPGLGTLTRFALVSFEDDPDGDTADRGDRGPGQAAFDPVPVVYELRSLEQPEIGLLVGVASAFFSHYEVELDDQTCAELELTEETDALVLVVLTVGTDVAATTANLMAPVIINGRTRTAAQVILSGSDWPVRAPVG
jgi:flagellar assembly factor FliW